LKPKNPKNTEIAMSNIPEYLPFGRHTIRVVTINNVPKFAATDISNILGCEKSNKMLRRFCISTPEYIRLETSGGPQYFRMIDVDDLQAILSRRRHKNVALLQGWLENVILPAMKPQRNLLAKLFVLISGGVN